jgi:hypothetical protein
VPSSVPQQLKSASQKNKSPSQTEDIKDKVKVLRLEDGKKHVADKPGSKYIITPDQLPKKELEEALVDMKFCEEVYRTDIKEDEVIEGWTVTNIIDDPSGLYAIRLVKGNEEKYVARGTELGEMPSGWDWLNPVAWYDWYDKTDFDDLIADTGVYTAGKSYLPDMGTEKLKKQSAAFEAFYVGTSEEGKITTATGHSLGGVPVQEFSRKHGIQTRVVNSPSIPYVSDPEKRADILYYSSDEFVSGVGSEYYQNGVVVNMPNDDHKIKPTRESLEAVLRPQGIEK